METLTLQESIQTQTGCTPQQRPDETLIYIKKKIQQKDTSSDGLLFTERSIISPVSNASALTWFIRYISLLKFTLPKS
jgi:hypothetical protein